MALSTPMTLTALLDDVGPRTGDILGTRLLDHPTLVQYTDDRRPALDGLAAPGAVIALTDEHGRRLGTTVAGDDGRWQVAPAEDLPNGSHVLRAWTLTDAGAYPYGDASQSVAVTLFVDAAEVVPPGVLAITGVEDNIGPTRGSTLGTGHEVATEPTDDARPTLQGVAAPGAELVISLAGQAEPLGTARASASGTWSFTPDTPLPDGWQTLLVQDDARQQTDRLELSVSAGAMPPPVILEVIATDDGLPVLPGQPLPQAEALRVRGTSEPLAVITLYDGEHEVARTTADSGWHWSFVIAPADLPPGVAVHRLTVVASDMDGGRATPSVYSHDLLAPDQPPRAPLPPVITDLLDDVGASRGLMTAGQGASDDRRPQLSGTSEPGTRVEIHDLGVRIGEAVAGPDWRWTYTPEADLSDGRHVFTVVALDPLLGTRTAGPNPFALDVGIDLPGRPPVITDVFYEGHAPAPRVPDGGAIDASVVWVRGTAEPGTRIDLYDQGVRVAGVLAGPDGQWQAPPVPARTAGTHAYTAQATWLLDGQTAVATSSAYTITVDSGEHSVLRPVITTVLDDVGPEQGRLGGGSVTDDHRLVLEGTAQPGAIVALYAQGVLLGETVAGDDWRWTFQAPELPDGGYQLSALAWTPDRLASAPTAQPISLTLAQPSREVTPPELTGIIDDAGARQGLLAVTDPGQTDLVTDDLRPTLAGLAGPGDIVEVTLTGPRGQTLALGHATADATGRWTLTPDTDLPPSTEAPYGLQLTARAPDDASASVTRSSNLGEVPWLTLVADDRVAAAPTITAILDDAGPVQGALPLDGTARTDDTQPTFTGTGTPGATLVLSAYGPEFIPLGTTTVDADGHWTLTPAEPLPVSPEGNPTDVLADAISPAGWLPGITSINLHDLLAIGPDPLGAALEGLAGTTPANPNAATAPAGTHLATQALDWMLVPGLPLPLPIPGAEPVV